MGRHPVRLKICVLLGVSALSLAAQTLPAERIPQFWEGDRLITLEGSRMVVESPKAPKEVRFLGEGLVASYRREYWDGSYWVCQPMARDGVEGWALHRSSDGLQRELMAWVPKNLPEGPVYNLSPLPGNRYLVVSKRLFVRSNQASFLAVGRVDDRKQIQIDQLVDVDLGDRLLEGASKPEFLQKPEHLLYLTGFIAGPLRAGDHLLFAHRPAGRFLVLDGKTLKTRFIRLFERIPDALYASEAALRLEHAVLGMQPRKNGHVLIASRSEEAVLKAREHERAFGLDTLATNESDPLRQRQAVQQGLQDPQRKALGEALQDEGAVRYPEVLWWDLDPATGTITPEPTPVGAPSALTQARFIRRFTFRFDEAERVKVQP